jgi:hypothetical protein
MMKSIYILLVILLFGCFKSNAQQYGVEFCGLLGGLSNKSTNSYESSINGGFWVSYMNNNNGRKTWGGEVKLNWNLYSLNSDLAPKITIFETTIPVLLNVCLKQSNGKVLYLFMGPQMGFVEKEGVAIGYRRTNYSIVLGSELYLNRFYFTIGRQIGLTNIYPSQNGLRLGGYSLGIGFIVI